jgi:hypothetical protein
MKWEDTMNQWRSFIWDHPNLIWFSANTVVHWIHGRGLTLSENVHAFCVGWGSILRFACLLDERKGHNEYPALHITCHVWIHKNWYCWVAANTVHWIHGRGTKLPQSCRALSLCGLSSSRLFWAVFRINEGSKWVQLHITCPVWIVIRLILMSCSRYTQLCRHGCFRAHIDLRIRPMCYWFIFDSQYQY